MGQNDPQKQPVLGTRITSDFSLHIDLEGLSKKFRTNGLAGMELVFYPEDGSKEANHETKGKGAFQFGHDTPLVWGCTFWEFLQTVQAFGFSPYPEDMLAFQNSLQARALAAVVGDRE